MTVIFTKQPLGLLRASPVAERLGPGVQIEDPKNSYQWTWMQIGSMTLGVNEVEMNLLAGKSDICYSCDTM